MRYFRFSHCAAFIISSPGRGLSFPCAASHPLPLSLIMFPFRPSIGLFGVPLQSHAPEKKRKTISQNFGKIRWHILSLGAQTVAADCILGHDSPIPAPEAVMPLATVLSLAEITPESSRLACGPSEARLRQYRPRNFHALFDFVTLFEIYLSSI